jgi:hypothetical protein
MFFSWLLLGTFKVIVTSLYNEYSMWVMIKKKQIKVRIDVLFMFKSQWKMAKKKCFVWVSRLYFQIRIKEKDFPDELTDKI